MPTLNTKLASLELRNPTLLASGILGISADTLEMVFRAGAGAVVTKSISLEPREGHRNPTIVGLEHGLLNAIGLANQGAEAFKEELQKMRGEKRPIIVSIVGRDSEEFAKAAALLDDAPVKAFELNLSCPHVKGYGLELGSDPSSVAEIIKAVKKRTKKPIFVKLSPNVTDVVQIAQVAEEAGADAITATNTIRAMAIDIESFKPILSNKVGGLSGPALKPVALRCVYEIYQQVKIPIIGCGGITGWQDAIEYLLAGARAVQIGTAITYKGLKVFDEVIKGITSYLLKMNFKRVDELVGLSHKA